MQGSESQDHPSGLVPFIVARDRDATKVAVQNFDEVHVRHGATVDAQLVVRERS